MGDIMEITKKQNLVLDYIKKFIASHGYSPTVREIQQGLGLKSPSTVHEHLKALELKGIIITNPKKSRTIELLVENEYLKPQEDILKIPYIDDESRFIYVPKIMLNDYNPDDIYAYKKNNHIYMVNKSIKKASDRYLKEIDATIISEIIIY